MNTLNIQNWFDNRAVLQTDFLTREGWKDARKKPVGEDCAFRRYFRLEKGDRKAILMEAVPDEQAIATPGHRLKDFIRIGAWLRSAGLHAPELYAVDSETGYILMEDFGCTSFKTAHEVGEDVYGLATDVLIHLRTQDPASITLPHYYDNHVHKGLIRLVDWYIPAQRGRVNEDGLGGEYLSIWRGIEESLPPCPQGFLHIDYHTENLMWLPRQQGLNRCGILDFQGAMIGPQPYDLANLLEDVRTDVPDDIRDAMLVHYCETMSAEEKEIFESWYHVLAAQFHCRVAGQFVKLAVRGGKPRYLKHLTRIAGYLRRDLEYPVLLPLKTWLAGQGIDIAAVPDIDPVNKAVFRDDAF